MKNQTDSLSNRLWPVLYTQCRWVGANWFFYPCCESQLINYRHAVILQHILSAEWALFSLGHNANRIGLNFVYYIIGISTVHHVATCVLAKMATSAHDNTSAGDSYSGSSAEIVHTSSESETQISNKRIILNRLLCYNNIIHVICMSMTWLVRKYQA